MGSLRDIQLFPGPEQKCLLLPQRKRPNGLIQRGGRSLERQLIIARQFPLVGHRFDRIVLVFVILPGAKPLPPPITNPCTPIPIANTALKNRVEQRPPLDLLSHSVPLHQLQHRILDEIQRLVWITCCNVRNTKCPSLDASQKSIESPDLIQSSSPPAAINGAG